MLTMLINIFRKADSIADCSQERQGKRFRIQTESGTEWLTEKDFTSQKKWYIFQKFAQSSRKKCKYIQRTSSRRKKKLKI